MPKTPPQNSEEIYISAEDADIIDLFLIRRSYHPDGSLRYVQVIGDAGELDAFARNEKVVVHDSNPLNQRALSLSRLIMQRIVGRPLESDELVRTINGKMGDCRRENLEITNRSELASRERPGSWSGSGQKYVYPAEMGGFYANINGTYLGLYDTVDQAAAAVKLYFDFVESGMSEKEATRRVKGRSRNLGKIKIE